MDWLRLCYVMIGHYVDSLDYAMMRHTCGDNDDRLFRLKNTPIKSLYIFIHLA